MEAPDELETLALPNQATPAETNFASGPQTRLATRLATAASRPSYSRVDYLYSVARDHPNSRQWGETQQLAWEPEDQLTVDQEKRPSYVTKVVSDLLQPTKPWWKVWDELIHTGLHPTSTTHT